MLTFFFFGDSLTLGVNDGDMLGWAGRLVQQSHLPIPPTTMYNLGVRRHTSKAVSRRWQEEFLVRKLPESDVRLMFSFGVVDTVAKGAATVLTLQESEEALLQILQGVKDVCMPKQACVLSPFPVQDEAHCRRIEHVHEAFVPLCRKKGIKYIDLFSQLAGRSDYLRDLQDGVHPGTSGCKLIAKLLLADTGIQSWMKP